MKTRAIVLSVLLAVSTFSCSDENKITAAFNGDSELGEGARLPFLLEQNYPNPFNPSTVIRIQIAQRMFVKLRVLTEDWQEVRTLVDETLGAGVYQVMFDGTTSLPSGDYYYVLEGMGHTQIRKMRLVK